MSSRYGRDPEEIQLDIAYAFGEGLDPIDYLRQQHESRWSQ